jgi:hypothetical protein
MVRGEKLTEEQCSTRLLKETEGEADHRGDSRLVEKMRWPRFDVIPVSPPTLALRTWWTRVRTLFRFTGGVRA